jgi:hypothetical protein
VAEVVVVEGGFRVRVLAGEAEGGVGGGVPVPSSGAPKGGAGVPGDVAHFVDEFGGGADKVGDDGEEARVDLALSCCATGPRTDASSVFAPVRRPAGAAEVSLADDAHFRPLGERSAVYTSSLRARDHSL